MALYRRKSEVVKAVQFYPDLKPWPKEISEVNFAGVENKFGENKKWKLDANNVDGFFINPGDWLVYYDSGHIRKYDDHTFHKKFYLHKP